MDSNAITILL